MPQFSLICPNLPQFTPNLLQLSLQIFVIDHWTVTGRGYLWVLSLQIFVIDHELWLEEVICWYCPCKFFHLPWTMTGRWYLWVLSLQMFLIDPGTLAGRGYLWVLSLHFCCNFFFIVTNLVLQQSFCCNKVFVATKFLLQQNFCWIFKIFVKKNLKIFFLFLTKI